MNQPPSTGKELDPIFGKEGYADGSVHVVLSLEAPAETVRRPPSTTSKPTAPFLPERNELRVWKSTRNFASAESDSVKHIFTLVSSPKHVTVAVPPEMSNRTFFE